jgi:hypothetical protein
MMSEAEEVGEEVLSFKCSVGSEERRMKRRLLLSLLKAWSETLHGRPGARCSSHMKSQPLLYPQ